MSFFDKIYDIAHTDLFKYDENMEWKRWLRRYLYVRMSDLL